MKKLTLAASRATVPKSKVTVPLSDQEVNVQFWCICLAEKEAEYAPLLAAMEKDKKHHTLSKINSQIELP
ncbi:hypothetical protein [Treponema parvum]|uniref:hypothetical protein n=1 Tax=Treponema parvum TaxID=138851 RepID=UPI002116CB5F|nr:hypothetical protein [Treponema parvum]